MTCQVIWPKLTFLHFCTLQIQYHIWNVPNFFLGSIFSILQILFYNFVPTHLQKEKENIPLKVAELPQVTLFTLISINNCIYYKENSTLRNYGEKLIFS